MVNGHNRIRIILPGEERFSDKFMKGEIWLT